MTLDQQPFKTDCSPKLTLGVRKARGGKGARGGSWAWFASWLAVGLKPLSPAGVF